MSHLSWVVPSLFAGQHPLLREPQRGGNGKHRGAASSVSPGDAQKSCGLHRRSFSAQPILRAAAPQGAQRLPQSAVVSFLQSKCSNVLADHYLCIGIQYSMWDCLDQSVTFIASVVAHGQALAVQVHFKMHINGKQHCSNSAVTYLVQVVCLYTAAFLYTVHAMIVNCHSEGQLATPKKYVPICCSS